MGLDDPATNFVATSSDEERETAVLVNDGSVTATARHPRWDMFRAYFNVVCMMAGTGILQLPFTVHQGGWVTVGLIVGIAIMANYTGKVLIQCLYKEDGERLAGYPEIGEAAFGRPGAITVHIFHKATLLGVASLFLILSGKFLREGFDESGSSVNVSTQSWTLISAGIVALPIVVLPTVHELFVTSAFGALCTLAVVFAVVIVGSLNPPEGPVPHKIIDISNFPVAFAGITLSFGGHATFPTLQNDMASKGLRVSKFNRVLDYAFLSLLGLYLPVSIAGYQIYGDSDRMFSPILCSLAHKGPITALKFAITVHVLSAMPILMHVVFHELEEYFGISPPRTRREYLALGKELPNHLRRCTLRLGLLGISTVIAVKMPYFEDMMSLVGAVCVAMMVFVMPPVFALRLIRIDTSRCRDIAWAVWLVLIILVGLVGGGIGAVQSMKSLIKKVSDHASQ